MRLEVSICMVGLKKCIIGNLKIRIHSLKHFTQENMLTIHNTNKILYYILYLIL